MVINGIALKAVLLITVSCASITGCDGSGGESVPENPTTNSPTNPTTDPTTDPTNNPIATPTASSNWDEMSWDDGNWAN